MIDALLRFSHRVERSVSNNVLAAAAALMFCTGVVGYIGASTSTHDSNSPQAATSTTTTAVVASTSTTTLRSPIVGFRTATFTLASAGADVKPYCGMLADTDDQRGRGLMRQNDLHGYDAMVFVFPSDSTAQFYMANVPIALSVAWFDGAGDFVSSTEMAICSDAADKCPRYPAKSAYRYALETLKGGIGNMHIGPGSVLAIGPGGSCV